MENTKDKDYEINEKLTDIKLSDVYNKLLDLEKTISKLVDQDNKTKGKWCVYKHTNKINGKVYIGMTGETTLNKRWDNGNGYKDNKLFFSDIQKYGWIDGFYHVVMEDNLTKEEAENLEKKLIIKYNSQNKDYGYNLAEGGVSCSTNAVKVRQYDLDWNFIKEYSSISEAVKMNKGIYAKDIRACCKGEKDNTKEYKWKFADETYLSKEHKTNKDKEVFQYSLDGKFIKSYKNAIEASIDTNIKSKCIHNCCQNISTSSGGFQWFYNFKGNTIEPSKFYNNAYRPKTPIDMFDKNMNFIKHYNSMKDVVQDLRDNFNVKNAQDGNIRNNLKGRNKTAYGFIFKYA